MILSQEILLKLMSSNVKLVQKEAQIDVLPLQQTTQQEI